MRIATAAIVGGILISMCTPGDSNAGTKTEYLSDIQDRFDHAQQGWGMLGIDIGAYARGQTPMPLRIKDQEFKKGLGHHAPGEIIVDLDGQYEKFEALVGVQQQPGSAGSVIFRVFVDGEKQFDSGVMRGSDEAKPASVSVAGAQEMRLVVTDAGDGVICDCADWADARLVQSASPTPRQEGEAVDVAQFGRVVTWDPSRMDGARASRIQEFHAEDLFLETDVLPASDGSYAVPASQDGRGCIGLQWIELRRLKEIGVELAKPGSADGVEVQYWVGESLWQGGWRPLKGAIKQDGGRLILPIDYRENPDIRQGTRKVRWVFPKTADKLQVRRMWAYTKSRWADAGMTIQLEKPLPGKKGEVEVYNGLLMDQSGTSTRRAWDLKDPMRIKVRYCAPRPWKSDRTVVRLHLPSASFGVAVDDLMANGHIYVREAGVFVTREPAALSMQEYVKSIKGKETVLERVRKMPDQTLSASLAKTRNPIQSTGPVMLSLACDNVKFIAHREGIVEFLTRPEQAEHAPQKYPGRLAPRFGSGKIEGMKRRLDGGWLPAPVTSVEDGWITYTQTTGVVPFSKENIPQAPDWLNKQPLCVADYVMENRQSNPASASLRLEFFTDVEKGTRAEIKEAGTGVVVQSDGRLLAYVDLAQAAPLKAAIEDGALVLSGTLAPGKNATCQVDLPGWEIKPDDHAQFVRAEKPLARLGEYWKRVLAPAIQVELPDPFLMDLIRASQVHCLMAARNEEQGTRVSPWIASMSYGPLESESNSIVRGMCLMGHEEFTRRSLDFFIKRYNKEGFLTTGYTLMGTGWHLWSLGEFYDLYRDTAWMRQAAPEVDRVCNWIAAQREKTKKLDGRGKHVPEYGLFPPGVQADWGAFSYHYSLEGYHYAGLKWAAEALADIKSPGADSLIRNAADFRREILRAYEWTQSQMPVFPLRDGTWAPGYPAQVFTFGPTNDYFPGQDANRSWCYDVELGAHQMVPQGILDPTSREVERMMDYMEDVQFLAEGWFDYPAAKNEADWFNLGGFSKVQPYYCRNAEICALRDDVKPFVRSYFNTLASLVNTETMWFWEHFNKSGAWNKTHETGYYLQQTRFMLVMERGDELWLAPFVTSNWMNGGMAVAVKNAPTRFGPVSYRVTSHVKDGYIEATIDPPTRSTPKELVIRLRHPEGKRMKSVTVNGKKHTRFDAEKEIVRIEAGMGAIAVRAEY